MSENSVFRYRTFVAHMEKCSNPGLRCFFLLEASNKEYNLEAIEHIGNVNQFLASAGVR